MGRSRFAWIFLALVALGILGPVAVRVMSCGTCCESRPHSCSLPTTGFSLCCFHSASTLPDLPRTGALPVDGSRLVPVDETGGPPPCPRDILHVPRLS